MKKLGLKLKFNPEPYHVSRITNTFEIGKLRRLLCVMCFPLNAVTYFWVSHGYGSAMHTMLGICQYLPFVEGNKKYTLTCAKNMPILKLKKSAFLIQKIVPSDGILRLTPNPMKSSYFQRGRIDGTTIALLKKEYPL